MVLLKQEDLSLDDKNYYRSDKVSVNTLSLINEDLDLQVS